MPLDLADVLESVLDEARELDDFLKFSVQSMQGMEDAEHMSLTVRRVTMRFAPKAAVDEETFQKRLSFAKEVTERAKQETAAGFPYLFRRIWLAGPSCTGGEILA